MKLFRQFIKEEFIAVESILYHDEHLFKPICEGKYEPSANKLKEFEMNEKLLLEDSNKQYLQNDEEVKLIKIYQDAPDSKEGREALDKLVENKMDLIYSKVNKHLISHPNQSQYKEDLVQIASMALMKAIDDFDINSNNIFNAYAIKCITGAILNAYNPVRQKSITDGKVDDNGNYSSITSLDATVEGGRDGADKERTIGDLIPDDQVTMPGEATPEELEAEKEALLKSWLAELPEREQEAIKMYFPDDPKDQKTFEEIGKELKMSKMGAQKLVNRVISYLRKRAQEEYFDKE